MKELVIISGKGGTGKTSITAALVSLAQNAVVADCDVDAADLHMLLTPEIIKEEIFVGGKIARIDKEKCSECGLCQDVCRFDAISPEFIVEGISCEGCGVCVWNCPEKTIFLKPRESGLCYISNTRYGKMVHAKLHIAEENSGKLVSWVRKKARQVAEQVQAAYLFVDGPPGTGCPVIASIGGADSVLIITEPSLSAIHDFERVLQLTKHFQIPAMVCINKYNLNIELSESIEKICTKNKIPLVSKIPFDNSVTKAQIKGQSIVEFDNSKITNHFKNLWDNVRQKL